MAIDSNNQIKRPYSCKRLVVCCDGTWQASNHGTRSVPSNIAKISRSIKPYGPDKDGVLCPQITYYDAGVGTGMGWLDQRYSGAFGEGLSENVCEAYNFLVNNYEKGDEVYIFGFSRGGFTARSLAGLLANVGICRNDMMDEFWEMYTAYCSKKDSVRLDDTPWGKSPCKEYDAQKIAQKIEGAKGTGKVWLEKCDRHVNIEVVGVFDTVGSLGWPDSNLVNLTHHNTKYGFHDTNVHPHIKNAFHALALDEKRRPFSPTLWHLPDANTKATAHHDDEHRNSTNLIQCWFPGVHINVGGGSDDTLKGTKGDLESMANITFAWMVDRVREVSPLQFEMKFMTDIMDGYAEGLQKLLTREAESKSSWSFWKNPPAPKVYRGWGVGPINDSFDSQDALSRTVGGSLTRTPGQYSIEKDGKPMLLTPEKTREYIHPVVFHDRKTDKEAQNDYDPPALNGFKRIDEGNYIYYEKTLDPQEPGWLEWAASMGQAKKNPPERRTIRIPEFRIPDEDTYTSFESLERFLVKAKPTLERQMKQAKLAGDEKKVKAIDAEIKKMEGMYTKLQKDAGRAEKFLKALDQSNATKKLWYTKERKARLASFGETESD